MKLPDYEHRPAEIYARSFQIIEEEADLRSLAPSRRAMCLRLIHACGMVDILDDMHFAGNPEKAARAALMAGRPVLVDTEMVARGIIRRYLPENNKVICTLDAPGIQSRAAQQGITRSAAAIDHWREHLNGAVVAIGNAPTALFRLLEMLDSGAPRPAAILAFPVGFVGAVESKQALVDAGLNIPHVTLLGRRGGSAMAAAAVNALCWEAP